LHLTIAEEVYNGTKDKTGYEPAFKKMLNFGPTKPLGMGNKTKR
jgi:hypothetical protein